MKNETDLFETLATATKPDLDLFTSQGLKFNGADYVPQLDQIRLTGQIKRVFALMKDGVYRTLREMAEATGDPESSISAQLRHLRKPRFGSHNVDKRRRGEKTAGLWEYQLNINLFEY